MDDDKSVRLAEGDDDREGWQGKGKISKGAPLDGAVQLQFLSVLFLLSNCPGYRRLAVFRYKKKAEPSKESGILEELVHAVRQVKNAMTSSTRTVTN